MSPRLERSSSAVPSKSKMSNEKAASAGKMNALKKLNLAR